MLRGDFPEVMVYMSTLLALGPPTGPPLWGPWGPGGEAGRSPQARSPRQLALPGFGGWLAGFGFFLGLSGLDFGLDFLDFPLNFDLAGFVFDF